MVPYWWPLLGLWLAQVGAIITIPFTVDENNTYTSQISVGTPSQTININLDFALADLTLIETRQCYNDFCGSYYNLSVTETATGAQYFLDTTVPADGSALSGFYVEDAITIGGLVQNDTIILIRNASSISQRDNSVGFSSFEGPESYNNIWGLGPRGSQAGVLWMEDDGTPGPVYDGLLRSLPNISESFSIWVDPATQKYGSLILGGLDQSLFEPESLVTVPISNSENSEWLDYTNGTASAEPVYLGVDVTSVQILSTNSTNNNILYYPVSETAVLDSRFNLAMPPYLLQVIGQGIGGVYNATYAAFLIKCDLDLLVNITINSVFSLTFTIAEHSTSTPVKDASGNNLCTLDIDFADQIYLSNRLLKKAYIAVNYLTNHISFALPKISSGSERHYVSMNSTYPYANGRVISGTS